MCSSENRHPAAVHRAARFRAVAAALLAAGLGAGCGSATTEEQLYRDAMEAERHMRESIRQTLDGGRAEEAAIGLARESKAPDGVSLTDEWVRRLLNGKAGDVLFPRWQAKRRGVGRYEVWFSYTLLAGDGNAGREGLAWMVDLSLKMVEGPRELSAKELGQDPSTRDRPRPPSQTSDVELLQD